jgi:hypothetical protein
VKVGRRADEEQQPRWSEQRVLSFEFKLFIFKNSSTLFITLLTHSLTHSLTSAHQHISTSAHQHISTSAHQHISTSLPTILSSFLKSIVSISYIVGDEVFLSPLVPTTPRSHSLTQCRTPRTHSSNTTQLLFFSSNNMPTHRGSSGRASLSSADQFRTIQESTKLCEQVLENVSRVISESKQNAIINEKMAQEWSEEIIALANANVAIDDAVSYAKRNLETFENDANNSTDRKAVVKKIKSDVLKLSKTDTSKSKFVTSIGRILQVCHCNIDIILWIAVIISY